MRLLVLLFLATPIQAQQLFEVRELSLEIAGFKNYRNPYFLKEDNSYYHLTHRMGLNWNLDITACQDYAFCNLYWNNKTHGAINGQVRYAGWEFEFGSKIHKNVDLFYYHHSEHGVDTERPYRYPTEDSYGVRIFFLKKD